MQCCELPSLMFSTKIFINTQRSSSPKFIWKQFWVLKLTEKFKGIGTSCHHTAVDLQLNIGGNLQGISMFIVVNKMFKRKTYADRLQDTLDLDSRKFAIPGSCQIPGDEHLQVDWLENLNVRLRAILVQCGSKNHSCFAATKKTVSRFEASLTPQHLFYTFYSQFSQIFLWIVTWTVSAESASHPSFLPPLAVRNLQLATDRSCFPL